MCCVRLCLSLGLFAVLLLWALLLVGNYFYTYALVPTRGKRKAAIADLNIPDEAFDSAYGPWLAEKGEALSVESRDGLRLHADRVCAQGQCYAIIVHGYTSDNRSVIGFAQKFHERGFTVLLPDMRGHGKSEGNAIGMGWHDRLDMLAWIDRIISQDEEAQILLFGISMGGATVMMTAGEKLPSQVKAVVEDCGYSSVWEEFSVQMRAQFHLPAFPVLHAVSLVTKIRAGFWLSEADAVRQLRKARLPILFIHGQEDRFVPFSMLAPLYAAAQGEKEKLAVPGAGHGVSALCDPEGYWAAVDSFWKRYFTP